MIDYIRAIKSQVLVLGLMFFVKILVWKGVLPTEDYALQTLRNLFQEYGIIAVALASFLENIIGFGAYFPGSIIILTAMSLTAGDVYKALITFASIVVPSFIAHVFNYFIGHFAFKSVEKILFKNGNVEQTVPISINRMLFSTLWHPHFAASTSVILGDKISFSLFLKRFIPIHFFWNIFWGVLMYNFGIFGKSNLSFSKLFYLYLLVWVLWDLFNVYRMKSKRI